MPRYALTIAYDGTNFCGWQRQEHRVDAARQPAETTTKASAAPDDAAPAPPQGPALNIPARHILAPPDTADRDLHPGPGEGRVELRTVQAVIQRAVRSVVREPVEVTGASRTDSGVHARAQTAAFTTSDDPESLARGCGWPLERGADRLLRALNGRLPDDVLVTACLPVPDLFDPIADCESKGYSYTLHAGRTRPLMDRTTVMQIWEPLDIRAMQHAASRLIGEHDFAAFATAGHGRLSTVRHVLRCDVFDLGPAPDCGPSRATDVAAPRDIGAPASQAGGASLADARRIRIEVASRGFLYNMVRIIAGTLVEVGKGKLSPDHVSRALESKDRRQAGPTLPPQGLCLEWIRYRPGALGEPVTTPPVATAPLAPPTTTTTPAKK